MIDIYGLIGSFDLPSMSTDDLRCAAARPYTFEYMLLKRRMANKSAIKLSPEGSILSFYAAKMVPGGRWLATLAKRAQFDSYWLMIWDLQYPVKKNFKKVAGYNFPLGFIPKKLHLLPAKQYEQREGVTIIAESNR